MATNLPPPNPLSYEGQVVTPCIRRTTSPTTANTGFPVPTIWVNTTTQKAWILVSIALGVADWEPLAGGVSEVDSMTVDTFTAPGTNPVLADSVTGTITVTGDQVAAGTTPNVIRTDSLAPNTYTIEIQRSQAVNVSTIGDNGVCHFDDGAFAVDANGFVTLKGGSEAIDSVAVDANTAPGTNPVLPTAAGLITVTGAQVAAGTTANVIRSDSLAANTYTIEIQRSQAVATSTIADNGVCHFDSGSFGVDANGFVTLRGGSEAIDSVGVDAATAPGTNPVLPNASGLINVTGGQVAAGTTSSVIRTDALAANTYTIEIQRSQAVASTTIADNGVCHFDSGSFSVDANGFVTLLGGSQAIDSIGVDAATAPGTNPVLPTTGGLVTVTGAQVAAGTTANVIRTDSIAANAYTIEIQRASAQVATTLASNGVSHFNSADFTVDANGFVSAIAGTAGISQVNIQTFTGSGTYTPTANMKYCVIEVVGAGGGSGGISSTGSHEGSASGGGGGGGYARGAFSSATIGASQSITVGAGGTAGSAGNNAGGTGGTTSVGALLSATGGVGSNGCAAIASGSYFCVHGGAGGAGTGGSFQTTGAPGDYSVIIGGFLLGAGGTGGSSFFGGGGIGGDNEAATAGTSYGGGASGGGQGENLGDQAGAAGAGGICIITEYI